MPETLPIGTPFHAVVLRPLSDKFPVTGEVVIGKILNEQGDFRIRSRHPGKFQHTEEFQRSFLYLIRIIPDTDKPRQTAKLNDSIWRRHVREKYKVAADLGWTMDCYTPTMLQPDPASQMGQVANAIRRSTATEAQLAKQQQSR